MTTTTFHAPGGQAIRQMQDCGEHHVIIEKKKTDYVEIARCNGQDNFTSESWNEDVDCLINGIKEWAYCPEKLTFEIKG